MYLARSAGRHFSAPLSTQLFLRIIQSGKPTRHFLTRIVLRRREPLFLYIYANSGKLVRSTLSTRIRRSRASEASSFLHSNRARHFPPLFYATDSPSSIGFAFLRRYHAASRSYAVRQLIHAYAAGSRKNPGCASRSRWSSLSLTSK